MWPCIPLQCAAGTSVAEVFDRTMDYKDDQYTRTVRGKRNHTGIHPIHILFWNFCIEGLVNVSVHSLFPL